MDNNYTKLGPTTSRSYQKTLKKQSGSLPDNNGLILKKKNSLSLFRQQSNTKSNNSKLQKENSETYMLYQNQNILHQKQQQYQRIVTQNLNFEESLIQKNMMQRIKPACFSPTNLEQQYNFNDTDECQDQGDDKFDRHNVYSLNFQQILNEQMQINRTKLNESSSYQNIQAKNWQQQQQKAGQSHQIYYKTQAKLISENSDDSLQQIPQELDDECAEKFSNKAYFKNQKAALIHDQTVIYHQEFNQQGCNSFRTQQQMRNNYDINQTINYGQKQFSTNSNQYFHKYQRLSNGYTEQQKNELDKTFVIEPIKDQNAQSYFQIQDQAIINIDLITEKEKSVQSLPTMRKDLQKKRSTLISNKDSDANDAMTQTAKTTANYNNFQNYYKLSNGRQAEKELKNSKYEKRSNQGQNQKGGHPPKPSTVTLNLIQSRAPSSNGTINNSQNLNIKKKTQSEEPAQSCGQTQQTAYERGVFNSNNQQKQKTDDEFVFTQGDHEPSNTMKQNKEAHQGVKRQQRLNSNKTHNQQINGTKECFNTSNITENQQIQTNKINRTEIVVNNRSVLDDNLSNNLNILNKSNTNKSNSHNTNTINTTLFNQNQIEQKKKEQQLQQISRHLKNCQIVKQNKQNLNYQNENFIQIKQNQISQIPQQYNAKFINNQNNFINSNEKFKLKIDKLNKEFEKILQKMLKIQNKIQEDDQRGGNYKNGGSGKLSQNILIQNQKFNGKGIVINFKLQEKIEDTKKVLQEIQNQMRDQRELNKTNLCLKSSQISQKKEAIEKLKFKMQQNEKFQMNEVDNIFNKIVINDISNPDNVLQCANSSNFRQGKIKNITQYFLSQNQS